MIPRIKDPVHNGSTGGRFQIATICLLVNPFCFNLICKTDTREEAMEYDKNAIGVFKSDDPETLVRHLPIEISCLLTYFLEASPENKLNAIVIGKRKREAGLVVPAKYAALTKNKTFAIVLARKLQEKKRKHPNFESEITTTTVTKVVTNVKYEKMD